jgi:phosphoserine phosphatase
MNDILSLTPRFRVLNDAEVDQRLSAAIDLAMVPANARYKNAVSRRLVFANMDDVLCDNLLRAALMVANVDTLAVDEARADRRITKAHQVWCHFHGLLAEREVNLQELVNNVVRDHNVFPGVFKFRERLTQVGVGLVAISNGMGSFLQSALDRHHRLEVPIFANELVFQEGAYWGLELVHGEDMINKGEIVNIAAGRHHVQPVACIGDGESDIPMAEAVVTHGGFVVSCGDKSPLTLWCRDGQPKGKRGHVLVEGQDFLVYDKKGGLNPEMRNLITGLVPSVPRRRAHAA